MSEAAISSTSIRECGTVNPINFCRGAGTSTGMAASRLMAVPICAGPLVRDVSLDLGNANAANFWI
jgi:hypothetical protein